MDTKAAIQSQFLATLEILKQAIEQCTEEMWSDPAQKNKFWHIAYHTLFFTHFYLHPAEGEFVAWEKHRDLVSGCSSLPKFRQTSRDEPRMANGSVGNA